MVRNVRPIGDRVIVKPDKPDGKRPSGIIIPETVQEKPNFGTVEAAGPGIDPFPTIVRIGDRIIYSKNAGTDIVIDGQSYLIMRECDIYCIL